MQQNLLEERGGTIALSRGALRQGQNANTGGVGNYNTFEIQNNVQFMIDGVFGTLAPTNGIAGTPFSAGHSTIVGCNSLFYGVWVNNTNVVATTAGTVVNPANLGGSGGFANRVMEYPPLVRNNALIGLIKVKVGTGASFVPGTTNLNATNITATFLDTAVMPTIPQQS